MEVELRYNSPPSPVGNRQSVDVADALTPLQPDDTLPIRQISYAGLQT